MADYFSSFTNEERDWRGEDEGDVEGDGFWGSLERVTHFGFERLRCCEQRNVMPSSQGY